MWSFDLGYTIVMMFKIILIWHKIVLFFLEKKLLTNIGLGEQVLTNFDEFSV